MNTVPGNSLGRVRRVNRRLFTQRGGGAALPPWWPGMAGIQRRALKAERAWLVAQENRALAVWLAIRWRGASVRWLAPRLGVAASTLQRYLEAGDRIVVKKGWGEVEVTGHLNRCGLTRMERERYERAEAGRAVVEEWSAPGPLAPNLSSDAVGEVDPPLH